jgi:hypothetical protein
MCPTIAANSIRKAPNKTPPAKYSTNSIKSFILPPIKKGPTRSPSKQHAVIKQRLVNRTCLMGQTNRRNNAHEPCNVRYQYRSRRPWM